MQETETEDRQLTPLDNFSGSLSNKVYLVLKQAILSLNFRPGEIIRKGEVCEKLGVSRSPVSEAITRLANDGLVEVFPQAGTYVSRFSMGEIREGAFLREALELAAVSYVAKAITDEQLALLEHNIHAQNRIIADDDFDGFYQLDTEFHHLIQSFTGFKKVSRIAESSWAHVNRARQLLLPNTDRLQETLQEHQGIFNALEQRDSDLARDAMKSHLRQLVRYLEPLEVERPDLFEPGNDG